MLEYIKKPLKVKNLTIKNRLVVAAMGTSMCNEDGTATEQWIRYLEEKAKGGYGLIIPEDYAISQEGKGYKFLAGLWNDEQIPSHKEMVDRLHKHGAAVFAQIYHAGRQTNRNMTVGVQPVSCSPIKCGKPAMNEIPRELTVDEIHEIVKQFGECALRAKKCGFDGVEVHAAHGYLLNEFLSPYFNKRVDEYGGCLYNRMRILIETIEEVRRVTGPDFIIQVRLSGQEPVTGGHTIEDIKAVAVVLEEIGVDMLNISQGLYESNASIQPMFLKTHALLTPLAEEVKKVVSIPVITVGRINDPLMAEQTLRAGKADLVAMARASLIDPHMPEKAFKGEFDSIRYCIACGNCGNNYMLERHPIHCALNPLMGQEYRDLFEKPVANPKKVAVIGGGPAGMETAIFLKMRGHDVTIFEKTEKLGGQFVLAAYAPGKGERSNFTAWQISELKRQNIKVVLNKAVDENTAELNDFDEFVVATGSTPIVPKFPGIEQAFVATAHDVLAGKYMPGENVVVIGGGQIGGETAQFLDAQKKHVTLVEMGPKVFAKENEVHYQTMTRLLNKSGRVTTYVNTKLKEIGDRKVTLEGAFNGDVECSDVVIAVGVKSENALAPKLEKLGKPVHIIGDCENVAQLNEILAKCLALAIEI